IMLSVTIEEPGKEELGKDVLANEELGKTVILHCAGRIVRGEETRILCAAVSHAGQNIVLDLSEVDALDAAGIGALIALQAAGIYLQLMNPPSAIREILHVTKLDSVFEICGPALAWIKLAGVKKEKEEVRPGRPSGPILSPLTAV
ncbi:MAG: STAS domain-containing protein, partial [Terriglobales bacterium]